MAGPAGLPNPDTLNVFAYHDPDLDEMIDIIADDNTHPRIINDYVINPSDWQANNRGHDRGNGSGPPNGVNTVEGILTFNTNNLRCFVCDKKGRSCNGQVCIDIAKDHFQDVTDFKLQIREAQWGYGVFARENIPSGTLIGEYIGRLMPLDFAHDYDPRYMFFFESHADCDATQYGDITRYINHHCRCNTDPVNIMYGKRMVVAFETNRDITAGEEIFIDYGSDYFNKSVPCQCDAFPYHHTSETYRRHVRPDGTVSPMGFGTFGRFNGKKGGKKGKKAPPAPPAPVQKGKKKVTKAGKRIRRPLSPDSEAGKAAPPRRRCRRLSWGSRAWQP